MKTQTHGIIRHFPAFPRTKTHRPLLGGALLAALLAAPQAWAVNQGCASSTGDCVGTSSSTPPFTVTIDEDVNGGSGLVIGSRYGENGGTGSDGAVTISGSARTGNVLGGSSPLYSRGDSKGNRVSISGNAEVGWVYGGYTDVTAESNHVTISGGKVSGPVYGGYGIDGCTDNHVTISGGEMADDVYGSRCSNGAATDSYVTISGGSKVTGAVYGGRSVSAAANGNHVTISGGSKVTGAVYGGHSQAGPVTDNTVILDGGTFGTNADVYGGHSNPKVIGGSPKLDTDNTVTLGANFSGTHTINLHGGRNYADNNKLDVQTSGVTVQSIDNFEKLAFTLPDTVTADDTLLTVSSNATFPATSVDITVSGTPVLKKNSTINLISAGALTITLPSTPTTIPAAGGDFEFEVSADGSGNLVAKVTNTPQPSNITEAFDPAEGSITCTPNPVAYADSTQCDAVPEQGFAFDTLTINPPGKATLGACDTNGCELTGVVGGVTVTGVFKKENYSIKDDSDPAEGRVTCDRDPVPYDDSTRCTAFPVKGYVFDGTMTVTGARIDSCDDSGCTLISEAGGVTVKGHFSKEEYGITDDTDPTKGNITCTPDPVPYGDSTRCTAFPVNGYVFDGTMSVTGATLGACDATGCELTSAAGAVTVTGQFSKEKFAITDASDPAEGSIICTPNPVPYGESTRCTATPASGYELSGVSSSGSVSWTCDLEALTCTSSAITSVLSVSATFTETPTTPPFRVVADDNSSPTLDDIGLLLSGLALAGAAAPALRRRERKARKQD